MKQPDKRRVVASEDNLRTALRQQLQHNEQQNLVMTKMSQTVGRAGRLLGDMNKNFKKVDSGAMTHEEFHTATKALVEKFEKSSARGQGAAKRG